MVTNMSNDGPDTPKTLTRSSFAFLSGTFLSRLTGLGRDMAMAVTFGSDPAIAAFMVAFRFANLIRRLFGEGPFTSGFIPHYEQLKAQAPQKGALFFRDLFFSLSLFLILLIGVIELLLGGVLKVIPLQLESAQIFSLTMWMLPGTLFICLFGLSSGLLQCERRFFLTGFAPVAFNIVWVVATLLLKDTDLHSAMVLLSIAMIFAFMMQWVMLAPRTLKSLRQTLSWKECLTPRLFSPELRQMIKPFLLGIIGVSAVQVNTAIDAIFARCASLEGPAYLWYAIRIQQLPLALFGIALSAALLPPLTRAIQEGAYERYGQLLRFSLRRSFSLIFPCTLALFVLGTVGINLLYGRGEFSQEATEQTVLCLWGYGFGLLPSVFVLLLAPAFFANKDFKVPTVSSLFAVGINLALSSLFVFICHWGALSIALATSCAAWFNYFFLAQQLAKKMAEPVLDRKTLTSLLKTGSCTLIAAVATLLVGKFFLDDPTMSLLLGMHQGTFPRDFLTQALHFSALTGTFVLIFFSYAWAFNAEDVLDLIGVSRKRLAAEQPPDKFRPF
jgi:putative peptidoglycan lipid II flippase